MTAKIATMNRTVGTMNSRADSATPHRLAAVISAEHAQADPDPVRIQARERRREGLDPGRDADGGVQDVVDDQRGGGDQAGP